MSTILNPIVIPDTAIELFSDVEAGKYAMLAADLLGLRQRIVAAPIASPEDAADVQRVLAEAKRAIKTADDARLTQTKPLRDQQATINGTWGHLTVALADLAKACERKIIVWQQKERDRKFREEQAAREAAQRAAQEAEEARQRASQTIDADASARQAAYEAEVEAETQAAAAQEALLAVESAPRGIKTDSGTTSTLWVWKYEITDPSLLPRDYLVPDEKKISAAAKAGLQVPGCRIWQEEVLRTVTR